MSPYSIAALVVEYKEKAMNSYLIVVLAVIHKDRKVMN